MKCLTGRAIETYTYNDRQVARIVTLSLIVGMLLGAVVASLLHIRSAF